MTKQINGRTLTIEQITDKIGAGYWRALIDGKTVAVVQTRRGAMANGEYLARNMPPAMLAALVYPHRHLDRTAGA